MRRPRNKPPTKHNGGEKQQKTPHYALLCVRTHNKVTAAASDLFPREMDTKEGQKGEMMSMQISVLRRDSTEQRKTNHKPSSNRKKDWRVDIDG